MLHFGAQRGKEVDFPRSGSDSGGFYALWSVGRFQPEEAISLFAGKNHSRLLEPDGGLRSLSQIRPSPSSSSFSSLPSCTPGHFNLHFVKTSGAATKASTPASASSRRHESPPRWDAAERRLLSPAATRRDKRQ